jgi:hypothetical protein
VAHWGRWGSMGIFWLKGDVVAIWGCGGLWGFGCSIEHGDVLDYGELVAHMGMWWLNGAVVTQYECGSSIGPWGLNEDVVTLMGI